MVLTRSSLLLVDDDPVFCGVLKAALERRHFDVSVAHSVEQALAALGSDLPRFAVVDLKMGGASGLDLVEALHRRDPDIRIVVLTGYASIATAVSAIKRGATQYLPKPANADEIVAALRGETPSVASDATPPSVERMEWEHIQRVLEQHHGNISATARALNMYRRTLQRKLLKRPSPGSRNDEPDIP